jgi:TPR repeat protein
MYMKGRGISRNYVLAQKWFIIAAERYRHSDAIRSSKKLFKIMSSEQVAESKRLASDWMIARPATDFQKLDNKN